MKKSTIFNISYAALLTLLSFLLIFVALSFNAVGQTIPVNATIETSPSPLNSADDPAIWVHPSDAAQSLFIGTEKSDPDGGLGFYNVDGSLYQFETKGKLNNADVRYCYPLGDKTVDIVAACNRTDGGVTILAIDPDTRTITDVTGNTAQSSYEPYGFGLYHSITTGKFYALSSDKNSGDVFQYELVYNNGKIDTKEVRVLPMGTQSEGIVADDARGIIYVGEEGKAIWKFEAEPTAPTTKTMVDEIGPNLTADIEGLAIYYGPGEDGYLIASSQGNNTFSIYERSGSNNFIANFEVADDNNVDGVSSTDGIDVISTPLGSNFPYGCFIAHDDQNAGGNQNYKVVPWESIADKASTGLMKYTDYDPRQHCELSTAVKEARRKNLSIHASTLNNFAKVNIELAEAEVVQIALVDLLGKRNILFRGATPTQHIQKTFDLNHKASGIYFIEVSTQKQKETIKIINQ